MTISSYTFSAEEGSHRHDLSSTHTSCYASLVRHFQIGWALACFYIRVIPGDWYRRFPFLPLPPNDYLRWRLRTAYGQHRPPLGTVLRDVWQFGDWLRTFPG